MRHLLDQITWCLDANIILPAVISSLSIPDAAGAIEFPSSGNGDRYSRWCADWVRVGHDKYSLDRGRLIYKIRCNLTHEVKLSAHQHGIERVVLTVFSGGGGIHHIKMEQLGGDNAFFLDARSLCLELVDGAARWLDAIAGNATKEAKLNRLLQYYPNGLPPFLGGNAPVIA